PHSDLTRQRAIVPQRFRRKEKEPARRPALRIRLPKQCEVRGFAVMDDTLNLRPPAVLAAIERDAAAIGFNLSAEPRIGALLRTLVATKPGGAFLELGTGMGVSTAWILD